MVAFIPKSVQIVCILALYSPNVAAETLTSHRSVQSFETYIRAFNLSYRHGTDEYDLRRRFFESSLAQVQRQNSKVGKTWTAAVNQWSAHSPEELQALGGWKGHVLPKAAASSFLDMSPNTNEEARSPHGHGPLPEEKNWLHLWTAQEDQVHSQGCGNCWAAATASLLEGHYEIHMDKDKPRHFNFEEITSCSANPYNCGGTGGCSGSIPELALLHIMLNGMGDGNENAKVTCPANPKDIVAKGLPAPHELGADLHTVDSKTAPSLQFGLLGWERLPINREEPLRRALVERGPVAVAVGTGWQSYKTGIFNSCEKDVNIGHAMLLMGYGHDPTIHMEGETDGGMHYWTLQNSWGKSFGDNGHARFQRHVKQAGGAGEEQWCGEDSAPQEGNGCDGGASSVHVCGMCALLYDTVVPIFEARTPQSKEMARLRGEDVPNLRGQPSFTNA